ncbi:spermidine/putrescine ABC transporter substrate-binding protein [Nodosilinea sp. P-1105]|uniref:ABC transporter substrate-binding protein n=1 Tax=Nodosilinea sp. P-1105 TaxID=2546229 RepID=UPI00146D7E73|nr:spermidine/putrescine ABC transporter substrate-binding protein [Nodosilinea sp. P-1105]NMF84265.1 spermidine/putrescine ABC transporter substrate-binding protein [Nodosilinea sp. P-1105]
MARYQPPRLNPRRYGPRPTRRRFLQGAAAATVGLTLSNCRQNLAGPTGQGGGDGALHIYTWANYTDDALAAEFTDRTGIPVVVDIFDSNEIMLTKMQAGGGSAYSLLYPSDYMVSEMVELGMLAPIDHSRLQGLENLKAQWQNPAYDPNNAHSIPFNWGTTGLLYNRDVVPEDPTDWDFLWDHQEALSRRITLLDDMRETLGAALKSLGYSYNTTDPAEIEAAYQRLLELQPHIASFQTTGFESEILAGDLSVAMSYSSDAIALTLEGDNVEFVIPASGSSLWTDTMAIPANAPNPEAAYQWINFLLEPEVAQAAVERLYFATANQAAFERLPEEIRSNPDLYPDDDILARSEGIQSIDLASNDLFDQYWTEITSA